ncbi:3228_t:CDS:2, partial [Funneliformis geosporum]
KRKENDDNGSSSKKTHETPSNKKYKKERSDWDPKWSQLYPWLVRRINDNGNPLMYYYLDNHLKVESHISVSRARNNTNQPNIITSFVSQLEVEKSKIIALM